MHQTRPCCLSASCPCRPWVVDRYLLTSLAITLPIRSRPTSIPLSTVVPATGCTPRTTGSPRPPVPLQPCPGPFLIALLRLSPFPTGSMPPAATSLWPSAPCSTGGDRPARRSATGPADREGGHRRGCGGCAAAKFPQADRLTATIRRPPHRRSCLGSRVPASVAPGRGHSCRSAGR